MRPRDLLDSVAVRHIVRSAVFVVCVVTLSACGNSTSAPSITTTTLHVDVTDPAGDAVIDARVPVSPDLVRATADVAAGNVTFVIQFAPGTLDRQTTRIVILLDTDRNGSTGISQGNGLGADFGIDLFASTGQGALTKADPAACAARQSCFDPIDSVSIAVGTDTMQLSVPLTMLGGTDGRMCFQIHSYVLLGVTNALNLDFMPNNGGACLQ